ncbi:MAG TPA: CreA family protein [Casimicrobiaceae bacterium]|nr:CreA family protein [Casimicrobiaceae bacterium]
MNAALPLTLALIVWSAAAHAEDVGCTSTTFRIFGPNDKVCVMAFDDPRIAGVSCYVSQARTGGIKGGLGVAEDPSRFSIACRQTGPVVLPDKLPKEESVFSESTSLIFKNTKVIRMYDAKRNTLVYVAISKRVIEGSPQNSLSTVPIQKWEGR